MPKLELLMTFRADLKPPVPVGNTQFGTRQIFDVTGGSFEGPRLKGKVLASGGDSTVKLRCGPPHWGQPFSSPSAAATPEMPTSATATSQDLTP